MTACPVFDATSEFYQNIGLLKVTEQASRRHGDIVTLHTREDRDTYLLNGTQAVQSWKANIAQLPADFQDVRSNANTTRMLLGGDDQSASWAQIGLPLRRALSRTRAISESWFEAAATAATNTFIAEAQGTITDLRSLTGLWAIRSVAPAIFGAGVDTIALNDAMTEMLGFHRFVFNQTAETLQSIESTREFKELRACFDNTVIAGMAVAQPNDESLMAVLVAALPEGIGHDERLDLLRPLLFRIFLERLNIDGLGLFWGLVHLTKDTPLARVLAEERDMVADAGKRPLALSVAKEIARLYPERPFVYRTTSQDLCIDKMTIPAGATVLFSPWLLHRDPRYWQTPARFDGRRFVREDGPSELYMPFGLGPMARKQTEATLCQLASALGEITSRREFEIAPTCPPGNLRPFLRAKIGPRGPVPFVFRPSADSALTEDAG
ncbi:cytochrome P450 [uncultured Roseobacter sp.]|uniref:cytochrome P450 n=1 Tax=uncultured Roseobacter sp. TaxID=114847 RepID=UPI0026142E1D|nr:cytochrome P450 [uncultured Roseobacter sp.]